MERDWFVWIGDRLCYSVIGVCILLALWEIVLIGRMIHG